VHRNVEADGRAASAAWRRDEVVASWGGILAGTFATHAALILLGEIGAALGASAFPPGERAAHYVWGTGAWGLVVAALALFAGGWVASCVSRLGAATQGVVQGVLVWVVAIPIIGFLGSVLAIGAVTAGSVGAAAAVTVDAAVPASQTRSPSERAAILETRRDVTRPEVLQQATRATGARGWTLCEGARQEAPGVGWTDRLAPDARL
jgi:hypothetical protein